MSLYPQEIPVITSLARVRNLNQSQYELVFSVQLYPIALSWGLLGWFLVSRTSFPEMDIKPMDVEDELEQVDDLELRQLLTKMTERCQRSFSLYALDDRTLLFNFNPCPTSRAAREELADSALEELGEVYNRFFLPIPAGSELAVAFSEAAEVGYVRVPTLARMQEDIQMHILGPLEFVHRNLVGPPIST